MYQKELYEFQSELKNNASIYRSLAARYDLSEYSFWILYVLRSNFALMTQRDLCEYLKQPKQSINTGLKKLIDKNYIELSSADDKRIKYIMFTETGKKFAEDTIDKVIEAERKALTGLSDEEKELLFSVFHKYTDLLEERFSLL